jgi:hypothetical protein
LEAIKDCSKPSFNVLQKKSKWRLASARRRTKYVDSAKVLGTLRRVKSAITIKGSCSVGQVQRIEHVQRTFKRARGVVLESRYELKMGIDIVVVS